MITDNSDFILLPVAGSYKISHSLQPLQHSLFLAGYSIVQSDGRPWEQVRCFMRAQNPVGLRAPACIRDWVLGTGDWQLGAGQLSFFVDNESMKTSRFTMTASVVAAITWNAQAEDVPEHKLSEADQKLIGEKSNEAP